MFSRRILLLAPLTSRSSLLVRHVPSVPLLRHSSSIPSITQPSFWASLIPKPLRRSSSPSNKVKKLKSNKWNPATFYIVIFLLIGSMSIQMIALRNDFAAFSRRADAKIHLLRDIIEKVQKGEEVDVEGLLGTSDFEKEKEWEKVLQEIEEGDELWADRRKRPQPRTEVNGKAVPTTDDITGSKITAYAAEEFGRPKRNSKAPPGFY